MTNSSGGGLKKQAVDLITVVVGSKKQVVDLERFFGLVKVGSGVC